eukprot:753474-Hanusia_phi.AAC.3
MDLVSVVTHILKLQSRALQLSEKNLIANALRKFSEVKFTSRYPQLERRMGDRDPLISLRSI